MFGHFIQRSKITLDGENNAAFSLMRGRLALMSGFFILAYMILAVRVFDLTILQGQLSQNHRTNTAQHSPTDIAARRDLAMDALADNTANNTADNAESGNDLISGVSTKPRGDIVDRNGVLLATTLNTRSLYADALHVSDAGAAARRLVKIFPALSYNSVFKKLQSKKRFVWLQRNVTPREQELVLEIGEPGLAFRAEARRLYPNGTLAAHILGYTNVDNAGLSGLERSFNADLERGDAINLSLDVRLQHALQREVARAIDEFDANAGTGVIMDVHTGEVLAGVSLPDFDPNRPNFKNDAGLFNRLTLGVYELGSVFKIFSTAALLDIKDVSLATKFDAREPIVSGRHKIRDFHAEKRILTVPEVFMHSSNIGSAMMGQALGTETLKGFYTDLGLLTPLDFELREIGAPLVPKPWREVNTLTAAFGHGVATTPMQLSAGVASIVNGGYVVKPTVIKVENDTQNIDSNGEIRTAVRIVSAQTSQTMRQLMRLVVSDGTARKAEVSGFFVGGKTGTAEKSGKGGYNKKKLISSFVGIFPADNPKYLIFTMVDEPKGNKKSHGYATAGWVAAPIAARVVESMASILGIVPYDIQTHPDPSDDVKRYVTFKKGRR